MSARDSLFHHVRPKGGGFRHGRRWKVWAQVGDWFAFDVGLKGFWLYCGRLSVSASRHAVRRSEYGSEPDQHYAHLTIQWRRGRRA